MIDEPSPPEPDDSDEDSLADWTPLVPGKALTARQKKFAESAAAGARTSELAELYGYTVAWCSSLLRDPKMQDEIQRVRDLVFAQDHQSRLKDLTHKAIDVIEEVMDDSKNKASERLDAAKWIAEKTTGKPVQQIDLSSNKLGTLLDRLDTMQRSGQMIDVSPKQEALPEGQVPEIPQETEEDKLQKWAADFERAQQDD